MNLAAHMIACPHLRFELSGKYTIGYRDDFHGENRGFELFCNGFFVYFNPDFDQVLERYTRLITRNPNS